MAKQVWSRVAKAENLSAMKGGNLLNVKVGLFTNDIVPTEDTVLTDLTVATFDGYALSSAVTWGNTFNGPNGEQAMEGGLVQFIATGSTVTESVKGYYMVTSGTGPAHLVHTVKFDTPVTIARDGDHVDVVPRVNMPNLPTEVQEL